jgi:ribulose 1,5-bisphosphate synthetase/thiazole synthase
MNVVYEPAREVPVVREVDVLVVGGGTAGIAAGIAAARNGAKTLVVESRECLGGQMSAGLVVMWPAKVSYTPGESFFGGITCEMGQKMEAMGVAGRPAGPGTVYRYDPEAMKVLCLQLFQEAGVQLRLRSHVANVLMDGDRIDAVLMASKSGREAVRAKLVVDCTGDADVLAFAGAPFDETQFRISLMYKIANIDNEKTAAWFEKNDRDAFWAKTKEMGMDHIPGTAGISPNLPNVALSGISFDGRSCLDADDLTFIEVEARLRIWKTVEYLRKNLPGWEKAAVLETSSQIGGRLSRWVDAEYNMSEEEQRSGQRFEDAVAQWSFTGENVHDIPYRAIVPKKVENLLVGGRMVRPAALRIIPACIMTGEAAGTAAAMAVAQATPPRKLDVRQIQQRLAKQGVVLRENLL